MMQGIAALMQLSFDHASASFDNQPMDVRYATGVKQALPPLKRPASDSSGVATRAAAPAAAGQTGSDTRAHPEHVTVSFHSSAVGDPLGSDSSRVGLRSISTSQDRVDSYTNGAAGNHEQEYELLLRHQQSSSKHTSLDEGVSAAGNQDSAQTPAVGAAADMRETTASTVDVGEMYRQTDSTMTQGYRTPHLHFPLWRAVVTHAHHQCNQTMTRKLYADSAAGR
jgi:hypothetical protein